MTYYSIQRLWQYIQVARRRAKYARKLTACGADFQPLGPMILINEGRMSVGNHLVVRSFPYNMVEIRVSSEAELVIGDSVFINQGARISCSISVTLGDSCLIGDEVLILDQDWHGVGSAPTKRAPVIIGANVWLAARSMVLRGVEIGEGSVVAAGAVVTHNIPAYVLAAGVPARPVRNIGRQQ